MKSFRDSQLLSSELWGGEFWEDHYFERILGDKVTMQMIIKNTLTIKRGKRKSSSAIEIA